MIPSDMLGKRILITGDVNSGKTTLARQLLESFCSAGLAPRIAIVDMAPEVPEEIALARGIKGVGGKLFPAPVCDGSLYLSAAVRPPRLMSKSEGEALSIAERNKQSLDVLLDRFSASGRDVLFVNDISMYVQAGDASMLLDRTRGASTVVANGYYGRRLGTGALSAREATQMDLLIAAFPFHVRLPGQCLEDVLTATA